MIEILLISILCLTVLTFGGLFLRERRVRRSVEAAPDPAALTDWKKQHFQEQERAWLLEWIKAAPEDFASTEEAWYRRTFYHSAVPETLTEKQRQDLESHLIYWARRRVENKSRY